MAVPSGDKRIYMVRLDWTNNHGGHPDEHAMKARIDGYNPDTPAWVVNIKEVATWQPGTGTPATQFTLVEIPNTTTASPRGANLPLYTKFRLRIYNPATCASYKNSGYSNELNSPITDDPCTGSPLP